MSGIEDAEAWSLQQVVLKIETMIANHALTAGPVANILLRVLDESKQRIASIREGQEVEHKEEREKSVRELAIAYLVEKEAALNSLERKEYEGFLRKEFFTKADFESLEKFYTISYDKLTEDGKAEMSTRVWEGVRRKEYEFIELPEVVKEKEAERLYHVLLEPGKAPRSLKQLPEQDKAEFIDAMKAGYSEDAGKILNRECFAENVSVKPTQERETKASDSAVAAPLANLKKIDGLKLE